MQREERILNYSLTAFCIQVLKRFEIPRQTVAAVQSSEKLLMRFIVHRIQESLTIQKKKLAEKEAI